MSIYMQNHCYMHDAASVPKFTLSLCLSVYVSNRWHTVCIARLCYLPAICHSRGFVYNVTT